MLLPKPYPDELVGSILMRGSRWTGLTFIRLLKHLAGEAVSSHSMLMPSYPGIARACGLEPEALVRHHSLFCYAVSYLPVNEREDQLLAFAQQERQPSAGSRIQKVVRNSRLLKLCPECAIEDVQAFGESYWHCLHQLDGYLCCVKHGCELLTAPLPLRTRQQVMPHEVRSISRPIVLDASPLTLMRISTDVRDSFYWRHALPLDLQAHYFQAAVKNGYSLSHRRLLPRKLGCALHRHFGPELIDALGCSGHGNELPWPGRMLRRNPVQFAPIKHVLLCQFLGAPLASL